MEHIVMLILTALTYPATIAAAWLWERSTRRYLAVKPGKTAYAARLLLLWAGQVGPMWIGDENLLFFLLAFLGGFLLCYQGKRIARIVAGVIFYLLMAGLGMILDTACGVVSTGFSGNWAVALSVAVKLAAAAATCFLSRRLNPAGKAPELPSRLWGLCAFLSLAPLTIILSFSLWNSFGRDSMDAGQYRIAYTVLPFVLLSALALLVAVAELSRHEELERRAQLAQMRELYYEGLQSRETQIRTLRHDLRNHLAAVQGLLSQGDTEQAQKYLAQLSDSPALHGTKRICENELANVVLTGKLEELEHRGLRADALVTLPKDLPVADTDLCALLGNALDNAMEAAQQAQDKKIVIRMRSDRGMLMLRVENSFAVPPVMDGGNPRSTKGEAGEHGFGVRGMREIALRYGGTLETRVNGTRFELLACLRLPA